LYDTHILLVFVYAGFLTPYTTLIIASFIRAIPIELEEAAVVDGASRWQVLIRIVLPLARTGIACAAIFAALDAWNEFLMPVILGGETARPLTVFVASFVTQKQIAWGPLTAAVTTVLVPVVVVVVVLQRQLVTGLTAGSLKG
jgi:ABC-type glycerol-3-phosphate transport system permease component